MKSQIFVGIALCSSLAFAGPISDQVSESEGPTRSASKSSISVAPIYNYTELTSETEVYQGVSEVYSISGNSLGAGIFLENPVFSEDFGLEAGFFYAPRSVSFDQSTYSFKTFQASPMAKFWFANHHLAFGLGGYFAYGTGSIGIKKDQSPRTTLVSYDTMGMPKWDSGLAASLSGDYPATSDFSVFAEVRYQRSLQQMETFGLIEGDAPSKFSFQEWRGAIGIKRPL